MNKKKRFLSLVKQMMICGLLLSQLACDHAVNDGQKGFSDFSTSYATALIEHGRDTYGSEKSPLFASALDRYTMKLPNKDSIGKIDGVRVRDRSLSGANMIHDIDLFRLLYDMSMETGDNKYAQEADEAIKFFFHNCQSPTTGLVAWGEHLHWDFISEDCSYAPNYDFHEAKEWPFMDQSYALAAGPFWQFVISEWDHQINDKETGDFSRHARYTRHETFSGFEFPRYAGQMIERWADAYNRPENATRARREELKMAINTLFNRMVENMSLSKSGYLIAGQSPQGDHINVVWLTSNLELACCLEIAAPMMDQDVGNQMREFALKQDVDFLDAPHKLDSVGGGFSVTLHAQTGLPRVRSMNKPYSSTWSSGYGYGTHAGTANTCFERFQSLKENHLNLANRYKELTLMAGDKYLESIPDTTQLLKPQEFSEVIKLMLNCYELTGKDNYLQRAVFFAELGISLFLVDGNPIPKATNQHNHYESITGGPAFMYQLFRLHVAMSTD